MKDSTGKAEYGSDGFLRRVVAMMGAATVLGVAVWALAGGWLGARSFAAGALISWLSFFLLHLLVRDVGGALEGSRPHPLAFLLHALRTLLLGGAAYVILRIYEVSLLSLATGLLVTVTGAAAAAILDLFYARRTLAHRPVQPPAGRAGERSAD